MLQAVCLSPAFGSKLSLTSQTHYLTPVVQNTQLEQIPDLRYIRAKLQYCFFTMYLYTNLFLNTP